MCEVSGLEGGTATRSIAMCSLSHTREASEEALLCSLTPRCDETLEMKRFLNYQSYSAELFSNRAN